MWKAHDTELDRAVAIKIPRRGQLSPAELEAFVREARMAAQLHHPNIVSVHEVGREAETIFIVSDLVRGVSLTDWLSGGPHSLKTIAEICRIAAEALHHAHQHGVIHRDLKPSNILMDEVEQPHIMDFGLAKREVGEITMTMDGQILGTPAYMSPEQAGGKSRWIDRRTDIYSMGVVLFRMLTGELPFRGNSQMQIHQRLTQEPPDPRTLNRFISSDLATICLKCLELDPNRRFATARELADELNRFQRGEPIRSRPISKIERLTRWGKRKPALASAAALTIILAILGPVTAATIYHLKNRQSDLIAQKNNAIEKMKDDATEDASRIAQLKEKLKLSEGQANPWELFSFRANEPPLQLVAGDFYRHLNTASTLQGTSSENGDNLVCSALAIAMLAEATGQEAEAIANYDRARDRLSALRAKGNNANSISIALADTYTSLARLTIKNDRRKAAAYHEKALEIFGQLADQNPTDARIKIGLLNAQVESAKFSDSKSNEEQLSKADAINHSLPAIWPTDSYTIYRLACYLTSHESILAPPESNSSLPRASASPSH